MHDVSPLRGHVYRRRIRRAGGGGGGSQGLTSCTTADGNHRRAGAVPTSGSRPRAAHQAPERRRQHRGEAESLQPAAIRHTPPTQCEEGQTEVTDVARLVQHAGGCDRRNDRGRRVRRQVRRRRLARRPAVQPRAPKPIRPPTTISASRRVHESPRRSVQNFDGISTAQLTATIRKKTLPQEVPVRMEVERLPQHRRHRGEQHASAAAPVTARRPCRAS